MLVHPDEAGNNRPSAQIQNLCVRRVGVAESCALNARNFPALDLDPLIFGG